MRIATFASVIAATVLGLTAIAEAQITTLPVNRCLAAKIKCISKYTAGMAKCQASAAAKTGTIDGECTAGAAAKLADGVKGCLDKAATNEDCADSTSQATALKDVADDYLMASLCVLDPTNEPCLPVYDWYRDSDGDGHGDALDKLTQNSQPAGYVLSSDDCNDNASWEYPGHFEICDNKDNDCDFDTYDVCPAQCTPVSNGHDYLFCAPGFAYWSDVVEICAGQEALPARIDDAAENSFFQSISNALGMSEAWIGGTDTGHEGQWLWADGAEFWNGGATSLYANWATSEPNNDGGDENCTRFVTATGTWNDLYCNTPSNYICERY
jgi:hypothetical protein